MDARLMQELAEQTLSCGNVYQLLARAYAREIDAEFADEISSHFEFESDDVQLVCGMDALRAGVRGADDAELEKLAVTFDRVFFGMGPLSARTAFPYESVYTSQKGLLMQEAYDSMRVRLRKEGLQVDPRFTEPDDHLAVQLAFLGYECQLAAAAIAEGREDEADRFLTDRLAFLENHLLNWVDRFAQELAEAACDAFYAPLARFTISFLEYDRTELRLLLGLSEA